MSADKRDLDGLRALVGAVPDPELPMLSIADLGVLRGVTFEDGRLVVRITPTYSGCPALDTIRSDVTARLRAAGQQDVDVRTVLAPAWSTDDISETGHRALAAAGIAPPLPSGPVSLRLSVRCPHCGSADTSELTRFGSNACTAMWSCRTCAEPFAHLRAL